MTINLTNGTFWPYLRKLYELELVPEGTLLEVTNK